MWPGLRLLSSGVRFCSRPSILLPWSWFGLWSCCVALGAPLLQIQILMLDIGSLILLSWPLFLLPGLRSRSQALGLLLPNASICSQVLQGLNVPPKSILGTWSPSMSTNWDLMSPKLNPTPSWFFRKILGLNLPQKTPSPSLFKTNLGLNVPRIFLYRILVLQFLTSSGSFINSEISGRWNLKSSGQTKFDSPRMTKSVPILKFWPSIENKTYGLFFSTKFYSPFFNLILVAVKPKLGFLSKYGLNFQSEIGIRTLKFLPKFWIWNSD